MCGIAGIYNLASSEVALERLQPFTDALTHRGPDGAGYELLHHNYIGLGHRRLSILDLSAAGKQPMTHSSGRYTITYNGEIFNFEGLKTELQALQHTFHTRTDTEVILAAYAQWGADCLHKFNGMWAMAIWDHETKELFLSRDRFGIKPLYYHASDSEFLFNSETRSFKYLPGFQRQIDNKLLQLNQSNNYALEGLGYTIFKDIFQILPGHYLVVKPNMPIQQNRWYDIREVKPQLSGTLREHAARFYKLFKDSCRLRLQSDVPLATALSGGLDSTSVYTTVNHLLKAGAPERTHANSQKAFTVAFSGLKNDERAYAEQAAAYVKGEITVKEQTPEEIIHYLPIDTELMDYIGKPITSIASIYRAMKAEGISVSLDGHGVDEMLFGYRGMIQSLYTKQLFTYKDDPTELGQVLKLLQHPLDRAAFQKKLEENQRCKGLRENGFRATVKQTVKRLLGKKPDLKHAISMPSLTALSDKPYDFSGYPFEEQLLYFEFFQHTLPALLRNFDRAGMMSSVEIRMPFMDYRLVEYVFSLPLRSKLGEGFTKLLLREAMKGKIDEDLRTRTFKVGVGSPLEHWFSSFLSISESGTLNMIQDINASELKKQSQNSNKVWSTYNNFIIAKLPEK